MQAGRAPLKRPELTLDGAARLPRDGSGPLVAVSFPPRLSAAAAGRPQNSSGAHIRPAARGRRTGRIVLRAELLNLSSNSNSTALGANLVCSLPFPAQLTRRAEQSAARHPRNR